MATTKSPKIYKVVKIKNGTRYEAEGTLEELIKYYGYTLETGRCYQHEKGNKKINCQPKSISALISNLNNASNNAASNGYSGVRYEVVV